MPMAYEDIRLDKLEDEANEQTLFFFLLFSHPVFHLIFHPVFTRLRWHIPSG